MDYKKAYEEMVQRARELHKGGNALTKQQMEIVCPELAESEDERIRKELIAYHKKMAEANEETCNPNNLHTKWIAYLEKQKVNTDGDFARGYDCGYEACLHSHGAEFFEKQKEQKAVKQDAGLYDAVDDYVRDHFIAGADFTPEYIKKLMENAFFAGVDYILLKEEGEL